MTDWCLVEPPPEGPWGVLEGKDMTDDFSSVPLHVIVWDPSIRGGEPTIKGTRILAEEVAGFMEDGMTWDEIRRDIYPSLPPLGPMTNWYNVDLVGDNDCWCTLPAQHDNEHQCEPCTERYDAPSWGDPE